jgi:OOP family OmpA-OmpF porin
MERKLRGVFRAIWTTCVVAGTLTVASSASALPGYATDSNGNPVRSETAGCVRTLGWSVENAIRQCDPSIVAARDQRQAEQAAMEAQPRMVRTTQRIQLNADTEFGFDKATLTEEGKRKLDKIADALKGTNNPKIDITGYTDRIGPEGYNEELSRRRADAARQYLIDKGVPADVITTAGRGESNPVVECKGLRGQPLVECLRPNRRSEVEFSAFEVVEKPASETQQQQPMTPPSGGEQQMR